MKNKKTFAYLGTHKIGKTTVAVEAIKCGLFNVVELICDHFWMNAGMSVQGKSLMVCTKCNETKQTDR